MPPIARQTKRTQQQNMLPPVDINHATREQLMALPGIGPVIADRIISARVQPFTNWADLQARVTGIKKKKAAILQGVAIIPDQEPSSTPVTSEPVTALPNTLIDINHATREQIVTLPGIGPAIADRIITARFNPFTDWDDLQARVTGIKRKKAAILQGLAIIPEMPVNQTPTATPFTFDPVSDLPNDLISLWLSFTLIPHRFRALQLVSHSWRSAISSQLPAAWQDVYLSGIKLTDQQMADVARDRSGIILSLREFDAQLLTAEGLAVLQQFCNLHVLQIHIHKHHALQFNSVLPSLRQLEDLVVHQTGPAEDTPALVFPAGLDRLTSVRCYYVWHITGLHNLVALTKLFISDRALSSVDCTHPLPSSLRELTIKGIEWPKNHGKLIARVAELQHLTKLSTDWKFECYNRTLDHGQLSFLSRSNTLERFSADLDLPIPRKAILNSLGSMTSLRKLTVYGPADDRDLQCLSLLVNLEVLTLDDVVELTSVGLRYLSTLPKLTRLHVFCCPMLEDYSPIASCTHLRDLCVDDDDHCMKEADVLAICQLPNLERLELCLNFEDPASFRHPCGIRALRKLVVWPNSGFRKRRPSAIPPTAFSALPALHSLEKLRIYPVDAEDVGKLVDCVVQMPKLRSIALCNTLSAEDVRRVREALPRLEKFHLLKSDRDILNVGKAKMMNMFSPTRCP